MLINLLSFYLITQATGPHYPLRQRVNKIFKETKSGISVPRFDKFGSFSAGFEEDTSVEVFQVVVWYHVYHQMEITCVYRR